MPDRPRSVDHLLPLKPKVLHILLALADGPRHGYSIMQEVAARSEGQVRVWPAGLYGTLRELEEQDLIAESETRPEDDDNSSAQVAMHEGDHALHGFGRIGAAGVADNEAFNGEGLTACVLPADLPIERVGDRLRGSRMPKRQSPQHENRHK